ncbi:MAG: PorV/PorQ family protein [Bacteroidota bacterium]
MKKYVCLTLLCICLSVHAYGQIGIVINPNPILTTAEHLSLFSEASLIARGGVGVTYSPALGLTHFAQNPALLGNGQEGWNIQASGATWLRELVDRDPIFLGEFHAARTWKRGGMSISGSSFHFSFRPPRSNLNPSSFFIQRVGGMLGHNLRLSGGFSLSPKFTVGAGINFFSQVVFNNTTFEEFRFYSFSGDLGLHYQDQVQIKERITAQFGAGLSLTHVGPKMNFDREGLGFSESRYIPATGRLGGQVTIAFEDAASTASWGIMMALQTSKLMVPSANADQDVDPYLAVFTSLADNPLGWRFELREFGWNGGVSIFRKLPSGFYFALHSGLNSRTRYQGGVRQFSLGAEWGTDRIQVRYAYLFRSQYIYFQREWGMKNIRRGDHFLTLGIRI